MNNLIFHFTPNINRNIYIKDPLNSEIGRQIIQQSNNMIAQIGFEAFTFKKLSAQISTTEATIYRYFENKQMVLLYLTSYYWSYVAYRLFVRNSNVEDAEQQLSNAIRLLCFPEPLQDELVNIKELFTIIVNESSKSYLNKHVDDLNHFGAFVNYKKLVGVLHEIILKFDAGYPYGHMLATTIIEGIHHQIFFAQHLPSLTDKKPENEYLYHFYFNLALKELKLTIK